MRQITTLPEEDVMEWTSRIFPIAYATLFVSTSVLIFAFATLVATI